MHLVPLFYVCPPSMNMVSNFSKCMSSVSVNNYNQCMRSSYFLERDVVFFSLFTSSKSIVALGSFHLCLAQSEP